jgi:hypothetical protein
MHEDAVKAGAPDAAYQHRRTEYQQSAQNAGAFRLFAAFDICGMLFAGTMEFGTRAWGTRRRSSMHRSDAGCNHSLRGFVFARRHHVNNKTNTFC